MGKISSMKQGIVLVTWAGTIHLAMELLHRLEGYTKPIVVVINEIEACYDKDCLEWIIKKYLTIPVQGNRWEVGGLEAAIALTDLDEWVLIQDTIEIKDTNIFDIMFDQRGSVSFGPDWQCYLGKYRREVLSQIMLPTCLNKIDAMYYELMLPKIYNEIAQRLEGHSVIVLFPEWGNNNPANTKDFKFDRDNIVLYNPYIVKRKSLAYKINCPALPNFRWSSPP